MNLKTRKSLAIALLLMPFHATSYVLAGELRTVRYSKEELAKDSSQGFIHTKDLSDVLSEKLRALAVTVTNRQGGSNVATRDLVAVGAQAPKNLWLKKLSTLTLDPYGPQVRGDENMLRNTLAAQTRKAAEVNFKTSFPVIERIQKGLLFHLDMKNPAATLRTTDSTPNIRYGLVESDILPSKISLPVASITSLSDMESQYATPAHVIYTIDRIDHDGRRTVFHQVDVEPIHQTQSTAIWTKLPSTKVNVKIDAADQNTAMSDQVGSSGAMPGMRVTVSQADGLITTQAVAGGGASKKSMTTEMKAPLYGEMSIARKYDYKMRPTETSAQNILGDASLPRVNLLYAHASKKLRGEWLVKKERFEYNVTAEPRQGWGQGSQNSLGKVGDKISFGMLKTF